MAAKLLSIHKPRLFRPGKPVFPTVSESANLSLADFIGKNSWLVFDILDCEGEWLERDASEWGDDDEYLEMLDLFHDLKVVNDLAERCVKDMEEFVDTTKDVEHRDNVLLVATDHRKIFQDLRFAKNIRNRVLQQRTYLESLDLKKNIRTKNM